MASDKESTNHSRHQLRVLSKFRNRLEKEKFIHNQASNYYMRSNRWFVIPGILITGSSSVISFLGTSDIMGPETKTAFNITVGVLTAGAAILQSISSSFGFETRTAAFSKAADDYDNLITKIEFELCSPNEDFQEFCDNLETEILKIKNDCKFLPPLFCHQLYEKDMKRRKAFKEEHIDNSSLTSIFIHTPGSSPTENNNFRLSVPNISTTKRNNKVTNKDTNKEISKGKRGGKLLKKLSHSQFQDAEEHIEEDTKNLLPIDSNILVTNENKLMNNNKILNDKIKKDLI